MNMAAKQFVVRQCRRAGATVLVEVASLKTSQVLLACSAWYCDVDDQWMPIVRSYLVRRRYLQSE
jgi:hypothetical protein